MLEETELYFPDPTEDLAIGSIDNRSPGAIDNLLRIATDDNVEISAVFTQTTDAWIKQVWLKLKRNGTIAAGKVITARIETDNAGLPSGSVVATSSNVAADGLSAGYRWVKFVFANFVYLAKNSTNHLILSGNYAVSPTNNISWRSSAITSGGNKEIKDTTWAAVTTEDLEAYSEDWESSAPTFAEPIIYTPSGGSPTDIAAIFEYPGADLVMGSQAVDANSPAITCREEDIAGHNGAATYKVRGITYTVRSEEPEGSGLIKIYLSRG